MIVIDDRAGLQEIIREELQRCDEAVVARVGKLSPQQACVLAGVYSWKATLILSIVLGVDDDDDAVTKESRAVTAALITRLTALAGGGR